MTTMQNTKIHYQISPSGLITLYFQGTIVPKTVSANHPYYHEIHNALLAEDWTYVHANVSKSKKETKAQKVDWSAVAKQGANYVDGVLYLNGRAQTGRFATILIELAAKRKDISPLLRFYERLAKNPSNKSREEAFDFLQHQGLPIMDNGMVRGYKGVNSDGWSVSGNLNTRVLQGKVDKTGRIYNGIGDTIEVERGDVDDVRENACSHGLHVGTYGYASAFAPRLLLVEFDPADIVSVPTDCGCQKLRCSKYFVVEAYTNSAPISDTIKECTEDEIDYKIQDALDYAPDRVMNSVVNLRNYIFGEVKKEFDEVTDAEIEAVLKEYDLDLYINDTEVESEVKKIKARIFCYIDSKKSCTIGQIQKALNPSKVGCAEINGLIQANKSYTLTRNSKGISHWVVRPAKKR